MKAFHLLNSINVGNLAQQGQCAFDLDKNSSDYQSIVDLANNSRGIAGIQAKNILNHGFGLDLYDPAIFPELKKERLSQNAEEMENNKIIAFPNPATDKLNFEYHLDRVYTNLSIKVYNANGSRLSNIQVPDGKEGFAGYDVNALLPGIYFYSICSNDHALNTGKLVIVK